MPFDPSEYQDVELDEVSLTLLRAADYIERHGWCQNHLEDDDGKVCLMGAIAKVADIPLKNGGWDNYTGIGADAATQRLADYLNWDRSPLDLWDFNDDEYRTKEEVVAALRAAAYGGE